MRAGLVNRRRLAQVIIRKVRTGFRKQCIVASTDGDGARRGEVGGSLAGVDRLVTPADEQAFMKAMEAADE